MNQGDEAVQATNDDATNCKRSAVILGYWHDPYLPYFCRGPEIRKAPEINRGYFARVFGMYHLILDAFDKICKFEKKQRRLTRGNSTGSLGSDGGSPYSSPSPSPPPSPCPPPPLMPPISSGVDEAGDVDMKAEPVITNVQIINLGCGYDTLYWRLKKEEALLRKRRHLRISTFVDVDFPSTTMKKMHLIKNSKELLAQLSNDDGEISMSKYDLHSFNYHLIGVDLRDLNEVSSKLSGCGLNFDGVTIFISECVLVYMETKSSLTLLKWIADSFQTALFINYEQVNMTDKFAEVMQRNLTQRGCVLSGVDQCLDLSIQKKRFLEAGWTDVNGWIMDDVYSFIPGKERDRIEHIELLDEQELLKQLLEHYSITVAVNSRGLQSYGLELVGF